MPNIRYPRSGSMQVWPRKRAKRQYARVRHKVAPTDPTPSCFGGYKAGMTHLSVIDNRKNSSTKGKDIMVPVTVIECPPMKIYGLRGYIKQGYGYAVKTQIVLKADKELDRKIPLGKTHSPEKLNPDDYAYMTLLVYTQPKLTGIGKKKPELFEVRLGGSNKDLIEYAKNNTEIKVSDVFKEGQFVDTHGVSRGKGFQGPVKRFGVSIRNHKSEKTKRGPGSISGGWVAQGHMMYRVAFAGQMGYHQRTEYNKQIIKISTIQEQEINPKGGFLHYGNVKNDYMLLKGSIIGPKKRFIILNQPYRKDPKKKEEAPSIEYISLTSQQGKGK